MPCTTGLCFRASDGYPLAATLYAPEGTPRVGGVVLAGAMATPQTFYRPFAEWLSRSGYVVLTFDYRGTFASADERGARIDATFDTWGQQDVTAAGRMLKERVPHHPLYYLGHSLGGQLFPSCSIQHVFKRFVAVASGNGYWRRLKTWKVRLGLFLATQVWAPLLLPILGYFPGRHLRKVGDLPRGVMAQWRRWCADPAYLAMDATQQDRFEKVTTPFTSIYSTDDGVFTAECITYFNDLLGSSEKTSVVLDPPSDMRIGHHGYFRPRGKEDVWPRLRTHLR